MTALLLFASMFVLVFSLGLQSLNVNGGHYKAAAVTSILIGSGNMVMYKLAPSANWIEVLAYLAGGPVGVVSSMIMHKHLIRWMSALNTRISRIRTPACETQCEEK